MGLNTKTTSYKIEKDESAAPRKIYDPKEILAGINNKEVSNPSDTSTTRLDPVVRPYTHNTSTGQSQNKTHSIISNVVSANNNEVHMITDWTPEEQKEINYAINSRGYKHAYILIGELIRDNYNIYKTFPKLALKYRAGCYGFHMKEDGFFNDTTDQYIQDIMDLFQGKAKFQEEEYYLQAVKHLVGGFFALRETNKELVMRSCKASKLFQSKFTMEEIEKLNKSNNLAGIDLIKLAVPAHVIETEFASEFN